jgi:hypothetical protein
MRSRGKGGLSATTQVKVLSPEMLLVALGQRFHVLETEIGACANGECVSTCRGLSPWRVNELFVLELGRTGAFRKEASKELKKR